MNWEPKFHIEDDDPALLGRFTAFMELVVRHARIDYLRSQDRWKYEVAAELRPSITGSYVDPQPETESADAFDFEEERLSKAFSGLTLLRKRILTLAYVDGLSSAEIAERLNCSLSYVYKEKSIALKILRDRLLNGGLGHGKQEV